MRLRTVSFRDLEEHEANDEAYLRELVEGKIGVDVEFEIVEFTVKAQSLRNISKADKEELEYAEMYEGSDIQSYRVRIKYRLL